MGIEKFVSKRGVVSVMWFNNGTNFIANEKELLNNIFDCEKHVLTETLINKCIRWKFKPPVAPHHKGVCEQQVSTFKHVFHAEIGNRRVTDEKLTTAFCLVEQS